jgi:hypothetical protein
MTKDEVISLAQKAGATREHPEVLPNFWTLTNPDLERFANLIVAAERERKAWDAEYWTAYEQDVAAAERERITKMLINEGWLMAAKLAEVKQ